jgi:hypothetical protein
MSERPIKQDPLIPLVAELQADGDKKRELYTAIRLNLLGKIKFYSKSVINEYRKVISEQHKAFANLCSFGTQPKTIILELVQVSSGKPVFVNIDFEYGTTNLLPSASYYHFANYPDLIEIKKFNKNSGNDNLDKFALSVGLVSTGGSTSVAAGSYPNRNLFVCITTNPSTTDPASSSTAAPGGRSGRSAGTATEYDRFYGVGLTLSLIHI